MSVNVLGDRKRYEIIKATGLPVLRAWVRSHEDSGRLAYLTIGWTRTHHAHRHAWYDRRTGRMEFVRGPHNTSCRDLFPRELDLTTRAELALQELLHALGGSDG